MTIESLQFDTFIRRSSSEVRILKRGAYSVYELIGMLEQISSKKVGQHFELNGEENSLFATLMMSWEGKKKTKDAWKGYVVEKSTLLVARNFAKDLAAYLLKSDKLRAGYFHMFPTAEKKLFEVSSKLEITVDEKEG